MKKNVIWLTAVMLAVFMSACGGSGNSQKSSKTSETLSTENQVKAKHLAEIDTAIKDAVLENDFEKALSMKSEMLELSKELGL